jgi:hypothetical protein
MLQVEYGDGMSVFVVKFDATIFGAVRLVAVTGKFELYEENEFVAAR